MYSRSDLKWFSSDDEADAVAAGDLMKAVEKLMFAVYVGWSYHPQPVVSSGRGSRHRHDGSGSALHQRLSGGYR